MQGGVDDGGLHTVETAGASARIGDLPLDCGRTLHDVEVAYKTYGTLAPDGSNAVLVCHALTGDQHVASPHPQTGRPGWWTLMVGPGRPIDPKRWFVISSNVIGGCMGSTGPASTDPATGRPYGLNFPVITIADMVRAQAGLLDAYSACRVWRRWSAARWAGCRRCSGRRAIPSGSTPAPPSPAAARHTAQNIALHEVGRQAVMADPDWAGGDYLALGKRPEKGLAVARMAAHVTYLSETALQRKFGRELQGRADLSFGFDADFQVESYLRHQGSSFVDRFDANAYLYITRATDYFDLAASHEGVLAKAFEGARDVRFLIASFTSDWLYPTSEARRVVRALNAAGARPSFLEIETDKGHDAFLLDEPVLEDAMRGFLNGGA